MSSTEATKAAAPKKAAAPSKDAKPAKAAKPAASASKDAKAAKPAASAAKKDAKKPAAKKATSGKKIARNHNTPAKKRYMVTPVRLRVKVAQEEKLHVLRNLQRNPPHGADKKILKKKRVLPPRLVVLRSLARQNRANKNKIALKEKNKALRAAGKPIIVLKKKTQKKKLTPKSKKDKKKKKTTTAAATKDDAKTVDPKEKLAKIFQKKKELRKKRKLQEKKIKSGEQLLITPAQKKASTIKKTSPTSLSEYALKKKAAMTKLRNERQRVFARTGKYPPKPTKEQIKAAIEAAKPSKVPQRITKAAENRKLEKEEAKKQFALSLEEKKKKKEQAKAPKVKKEKKVKPIKKTPEAGADASAAAPEAGAADAKKTKAVDPNAPKNVRKPHHKYQAIAIGLNRGYQVTKRVPPARHSRRKGVTSRRVRAIKDIIREVSGFTPYEKRIMELLRNNLDKRALKFAKKRLGTHTRGKKKREELQGVIQKMRAN